MAWPLVVMEAALPAVALWNEKPLPTVIAPACVPWLACTPPVEIDTVPVRLPAIAPPSEPPPANAGATTNGARIVAANRYLRMSNLLNWRLRALGSRSCALRRRSDAIVTNHSSQEVPAGVAWRRMLDLDSPPALKLVLMDFAPRARFAIVNRVSTNSKEQS